MQDDGLERVIAVLTALAYFALVCALLWQVLTSNPQLRSQLQYLLGYLRWWYAEQRRAPVPGWVAQAIKGHTVENAE